VIGMSRSGNHAIIGWIMAQAKGRVLFLNCVQGKYNPFLTARPLKDDDGAIATYPVDLEKERRRRFSRKDLLIYSHEDHFLGHACSDLFEYYHDGFVGKSKRRLDVLILRDPFNLFASRLRSGYGEVPHATALRMWKQHAREFLGLTRRLKHGPVLILYNRWVLDRAYRQELAEALGLRFSDAGVNRVAACAGGSSFDGLSQDGRAQKMKVFERWRHYAGERRYRELFDAEVFSLSERIFGRIVPADLCPTREAGFG
jgi:hypothetical protein